MDYIETPSFTEGSLRHTSAHMHFKRTLMHTHVPCNFLDSTGRTLREQTRDTWAGKDLG